MIKKKVDSRIKILIENCVKLNQRSFFILVGEKAKKRVVNLHTLLKKCGKKVMPNILWCYNKNLGFKSDEKSRKRMMLKKMGQEKMLEDPFHLFLSVTNIRYCYFKDTQKILGQTFDMLVIQEFAGITPNVLARTMETIEGGGIICILIEEIENLQQLHTMSMDIHQRFRKKHRKDTLIANRFLERFLLSLSTCLNCLVLSDEFQVLPISKNIDKIHPIDIISTGDSIESEDELKLKALKEKVREFEVVREIINICKTYDQGEAVLTCVNSLTDKKLQSTIAITAGRGRGKSACLGLVISLAIQYGYSNIFVTSPTPENVKTLFEFIFKGLDVIGYKEKQDYNIVQSKNPQFFNSIVRINVFNKHRQTVQYIHPNDAVKLGQAELLVIDEAAAIPLPVVKKLLGPYLIFISSTINGYEGTGRSLSLKLIENLKKKRELGKYNVRDRKFAEISLEEPIRYTRGDEVEKWLNTVLCLNATSSVPKTSKCPHPDDCSLYYVNRDTLFAFHDETETFLHNMVSLFVSSHYKNSPNDLQLMADAPEHHLFVLLGPIEDTSTELPGIYVVIQVCLEGAINRSITQEYLSRGKTGVGDLIPWTISKYFQETNFAEISGVRIVRIATHPKYQRMGYGSRAMDLVTKYYQGKFYNLDLFGGKSPLDDDNDDKFLSSFGTEEEEKKNFGVEKRDKEKLPPLLQSLDERKPEKIDYIGVSYGLTLNLHNFWSKFGMKTVYVRLTSNEMTGEHSCIMLKEYKRPSRFTDGFHEDFQKRFMSFLAFEFSSFSIPLSLSVLNFNENESTEHRRPNLTEFNMLITPNDLKRLNYFCKNFIDFRIILDLVPTIAQMYFLKRLPVQLNLVDASVLMAAGLKKKSFKEISKELGLDINQIVQIFSNVVKRIVKYFNSIEQESEIIIGNKRKIENVSQPQYPPKKVLKEKEEKKENK